LAVSSVSYGGGKQVNQPTVLITSAPERAVIAAARGLSVHGYRVVAVATRAPVAGLCTRAAAACHVLSDPLRDPRRFTTQVAEVARAQRVDVVLPGCDASLRALSEHRDLLEGVVAHGLPSRGVVLRSLDKLGLARAAEAADMVSPETDVCRDAESARLAARRFGFPVIVKPQFSLVDRGDRLEQQGGRVATTERELTGLLERLGEPVLVQPRMRGATYSLGGVAAAAGLLGTSFARYERTWPAGAGNVTFAETQHAPSSLLSKVEALVATLGWRGVFELELVRGDDGIFRPIDFNPRVYGSLALAVSAGANLPAIWCDHLLDRGHTPVHALPGHRYRWEDGDVRHVGRFLRDGKPSLATAVLRPRRKTVHAYFSLRDPAPLAARLVHITGVAATRIARRYGPRWPRAGRETMIVETTGRRASLQMALLRAAARTGHTYRASTALARLFGGDPIATVVFDGGGRLDVRLGDPYWSRLLVGWEYEPEVSAIIDAAIAHEPTAVLLDCGANIGYFSTRYASVVTTVAVEAVSPMYDQLRRNAEVNGFHAVHAAVWSRSSDPILVTWDPVIPASASVVDGAGSRSASVPTITVEELYNSYAGNAPAILKLDIEGAEVAALRGGAAVLASCLIVYEDHGRDPSHTVTRYLLDRGLAVYRHDGAALVPIRDPTELNVIKRDSERGYNFLALEPNGRWAGVAPPANALPGPGRVAASRNGY